jgi:TetR/AcrR family transcriptional repressor of nem operon
LTPDTIAPVTRAGGRGGRDRHAHTHHGHRRGRHPIEGLRRDFDRRDLAAAEITKGGFFYHFPDKSALAKALIERYIAVEDAMIDELETEARLLNDDPLGVVLVGLELLARKLDDMPNGHPGCLVATAAYQERLFEREVREMNRIAVTRWRERFREHFHRIQELYEPREPVDLDALADMVLTLVEGGIVLSRAFGTPTITASQVRLGKAFIKLLFTPVRH